MRKTIAYARKMRSQPRQAKSPPHCAAGSTESKVNTTTATPTPGALAIAAIFKDFAIDHTPDGWPAVKQMHLSAAATELERQHAEIEALKAERARSGLEHRKAVQEAVREVLQEARKACENLPAPDSCSGVERSLWDVATMACAEAVGNVGTP